MATSLVKRKGYVLEPIPLQYSRNRNGFVQYICKLRDDLISSYRYTYYDSSLPVILFVLQDAAERRLLSDMDCDALMSSNIPYLRMFNELFPVQLRGQCTRNGIRGSINPEKLYYPATSQVLDFFLFCAECLNPGLNLLSVKRLPYEAVPFIAEKKVLLEAAPFAQAATMRWRRYLREDSHFQGVVDRVISSHAQFGFWAFIAPQPSMPKGVLFVSQGRKSEDIKLYNVDSGFNVVLAEFCHKYRLEMMGSYVHPKLEKHTLNILPQRIHVEYQNNRVNLSIPDFYSYDMIRTQKKGDLWLLSSVLSKSKMSPKSSAPFDREELRKLAVKLRAGLSKAMHNDKRVKSVIVVINKQLGYVPKNVFGRAWGRGDIDSSMTLNGSIEIVNTKLPSIDLSPNNYRLWFDILHYLIYLGVWMPRHLSQTPTR